MNNKKHFLRLLASSQPDLATGALLIARQFQPELEVDAELSEVDALSRSASAARVSDAHSLVQFFADAGYCGNTNEYYDVNNSMLNQVLHRRTGIPITLGVLYLAVVKRLALQGLSATGINFPGHFLIATDDGNQQQLIDVFDVKVTSTQECYERINHATVQPDPVHFRSADDRDILSRILENLKAIYWQAGHTETVIECLDYQLMIFPDNQKLLEQQQRLLHNLRHATTEQHVLH